MSRKHEYMIFHIFTYKAKFEESKTTKNFRLPQVCFNTNDIISVFEKTHYKMPAADVAFFFS